MIDFTLNDSAIDFTVNDNPINFTLNGEVTPAGIFDDTFDDSFE